MNLADPPAVLLAASGGDTVKLFDVSVDSGDPCTLTYSPSPGFQINSVKWNHTNLVVASAGDDKRISLWRKSGQSMGAIPVSEADCGDGIQESITTINFSNKGSRYMCSGGTGQVVRIWDLQRKRCIKWLSGHTDTITGAMYNCKDEYLASISLKGDLILHNLASGARAAELKDPHKQVLRMLDYSRISRHLLVTAGDDGSVHLWDTTGRSLKASWLNQHSAPTAGVSFSPSNDKIIASVGLDKKLYTFDSGAKRPSFCISYEAPFSSLALRDDGLILAAGTSTGRVVFYDIRGKPRPITVLRAYNSSEAVSSLCWERSKPVHVNEINCTAEAALLGGAVEDSVLMPDPLPSVASSSSSLPTAVASFRNHSRLGPTKDSSSLTLASGGSMSNSLHLSTAEETPYRNSRNILRQGALSKLEPSRSSYNFKDDMDVFSPVVDVQPITPSFDKWWDDPEGVKKENLLGDNKPSSLLFPSSRRFPFADDSNNDHPIFNWKSSIPLRQDDSRSSFSILGSTPAPSTKSEESSTTPPEAWGGEKISDNLLHPPRQGVNLPPHLNMLTSGSLTSVFSGSQDLSLPPDKMSTNSLTSTYLTSTNLRAEDASSSQETALRNSENGSLSSMSISLGTKNAIGKGNLEPLGSSPSTLSRRLSTYDERISAAFIGGTGNAFGSPKTKKAGDETREGTKSWLSRPDPSTTSDTGAVSQGGTSDPLKVPSQSDPQQGTSFTLQLFQRTLEEKLSSFQGSIHADVRNLHIEILRQFHIQETEMSSAMKSILENQAELMKEVQSLRKENQKLRQLL